MASGPGAALKGRTHGCTDQAAKCEENSCQLGAVHTWHLADMPSCSEHVRSCGYKAGIRERGAAISPRGSAQSDVVHPAAVVHLSRTLVTANPTLWREFTRRKSILRTNLGSVEPEEKTMLNDLMWLVLALLAFYSVMVVPAVLVWLVHIFVKRVQPAR